ncbi:GNAT family N-acetyltransferase [Leisingera aquaemixtae]|uniref:GNAT family N-acetyltransferase n=1 Tax=Leisingera aquaemixtae TaxID=1396826 RepID=UPI001C96D25D|nr:GNAT family N-acetyltransferase [Leisingera aquaemixtae]MBY6065180.1 GNAT family N-acetyltransferase [Leisingera aquaemixtae]
MQGSYQIRALLPVEIRTAADWAAREGWNPGRQDAACFASVDPQGFWGGFLDGQMIACISVVNYGQSFAFLGFYIVAPEHRGKGYGYALWQKALEHAGGRVVGLDGVVDQQENYRRSGFELAYRNIRFGGVPSAGLAVSTGFEVQVLTAPTAELEALDARVFPAPRRAFWQQWLGAEGHHSVAAYRDGSLAGFGTLRPCGSGCKIGPLVAVSRPAAEAVLARLLQELPPGQEVFLDAPEPHAAAVDVARALGLEPVFETARMYRGLAPQLETDLIFGVTSFELG